MITLYPTNNGHTWSIEHLVIPDALKYRKFKNIDNLLTTIDPTLPTLIEVDGGLHDPNTMIPLEFTTLRITYQGIPYAKKA